MISSNSAVSPSRTRRTTSASGNGSVLFATSRTFRPMFLSYLIERSTGKTLHPFEPTQLGRVVTHLLAITLFPAGGKMQSSDSRLNTTWWALRVLFGFVPIAAGLDKFFNLLT